MNERKRIGRWADVATRHFIYESDFAIEIDEHDHFEIVRRRVFFDDVLLVTYHKELGGGYVVVMACLFLLFAALAVTSRSVLPLAIQFVVIAVLALVLGILRLTLLVDVVTVFGRRSKAAIRYGFRKSYAREVFERLCAKAEAAQQSRAAEIAASEPAPPPPPPITDAFPPPEQ